MLLEHEGDYGLGRDAKGTVCSWSGARRRLWFGHGWKGNRMLLEHEKHYGLGMDVQVSECSWNTNEIMVLYPPTASPPPIPAAKICSTTRPLTGAVSINMGIKRTKTSRVLHRRKPYGTLGTLEQALGRSKEVLNHGSTC